MDRFPKKSGNKFLKCFITNITASKKDIEIWCQTNTELSSRVESSIDGIHHQLSDLFAISSQNLRPIPTPEVGRNYLTHMKNDLHFHRVLVTHVEEDYSRALVLFIDFGLEDWVPFNHLVESDELFGIEPLAHKFFLADIQTKDNEWNSEEVKRCLQPFFMSTVFHSEVINVTKNTECIRVYDEFFNQPLIQSLVKHCNGFLSYPTYGKKIFEAIDLSIDKNDRKNSETNSIKINGISDKKRTEIKTITTESFSKYNKIEDNCIKITPKAREEFIENKENVCPVTKVEMNGDIHKVVFEEIQTPIEVKPKQSIQNDSPQKEIKKEMPQKEVQKESPQKEVQKESPQKEVQKDSPQKEIQKDSPQKEIQKDSPQKEIQKDSPQKEVQKDSPQKEVQKDSPQKEIQKDSPQKEVQKNSPKKEIQKDSPQNKEIPDLNTKNVESNENITEVNESQNNISANGESHEETNSIDQISQELEFKQIKENDGTSSLEKTVDSIKECDNTEETSKSVESKPIVEELKENECNGNVSDQISVDSRGDSLDSQKSISEADQNGEVSDKSIDLCPYQELIGQKQTIYLTTKLTDNRFYAQLSSQFDVIQSLTDRMTEFYNKIYGSDKSGLNLNEVKPNDIIAARFSGDSLWYRASVKAIFGNYLDLIYVDYGNEERVEIKECKQLVEDFSIKGLKPQSFLCHSIGEKMSDKTVDQYINDMSEVMTEFVDFQKDYLNIKILSVK